MYFENISPGDIFRQRNNGRGILIDLRSREDYAAGCIPGAMNIPYEELGPWIPRLRQMVRQNAMQSGKSVLIVYCDRGNTSLMAARDLYKEGFRVKNVYGGISAYHGPLVHRG